MQIRPATTRDARGIARVHVAARRKAYSDFFDPDYLAWLTQSHSMRLWLERIHAAADGNSTVLVASEGLAIKGYAHVAATSEGAGEVLQLFVHPESWREGAGSALLRAGLKFLADTGSSEACLWVFEANLNARAFYEHCGWIPDGGSQLVDRGKPLTQVRYRKKLAPAP